MTKADKAFEDEARRALESQPKLAVKFKQLLAAGREAEAREVVGYAMAKARMKNFKPEYLD